MEKDILSHPGVYWVINILNIKRLKRYSTRLSLLVVRECISNFYKCVVI